MQRIIIVCVMAAAAGCTRKMYDPAWATQPYPHELHSVNIVDMQVFRVSEKIQLINATTRSFENFHLWINQRYVSHVDSLPAGATIELSLWEFFDEYGDRFNAGGFFREYKPTPVRLVEIQPGAGQPMVGLITIRAEEVRVKPEETR